MCEVTTYSSFCDLHFVSEFTDSLWTLNREFPHQQKFVSSIPVFFVAPSLRYSKNVQTPLTFLSRSFTSLKPSSAPKKSLSLSYLYMSCQCFLQPAYHTVRMTFECKRAAILWAVQREAPASTAEKSYTFLFYVQKQLFFVFQKASELALIATKNLCTNDNILLRGEASLFSLVCVDESTLCTLSILVFALDILFPFFFFSTSFTIFF